MVLAEIEQDQRAAPWLPGATTIPALPPSIQEVPTDPVQWAAWANEARVFRERIRAAAATDPDLQRHLVNACAQDPAFFLLVFGSIYEPRWRGDRPPGWRPWLLFAFQVELVRIAQVALTTRSGPERHLLVEKARDMGASWVVCGLAAHAWLFAETVLIGMNSREASLVDARGDYNSLFFKVRGVLGIEESTPDELRLPPYLFPEGFKDGVHDKTNQLTHPTKPNQIVGETTTRNTGRGKRFSWRINDEAAFNRYYRAAKAGQFSSTDHILSVSSAGVDDGGAFREECEEALANAANPDVRTQRIIRLHWYMNPLHDEEWYRETRAEMDKTDPYAFDREVLMNYTAGQGNRVYPDLGAVTPGPFPYEPGQGPVLTMIDPGLADPTAILWVQYHQPTRRYRVVRAFQMPNIDAAFVASVLTGAWPGQMSEELYKRYLAARDTMAWVKTITDPVSYVGDPYGSHRGGDGKRTFYQGLAEESSRLTGGRRVIVVQCDFEPEAVTYRYRREAVMALLPSLDWHHDPDVRHALSLIQDAAYPDATSRSVREQDKPRHDRTSHYRSTLEFGAVDAKLSHALSGMDRSVSIVNLGGTERDDSLPAFARDFDLTREMPVRDDRTLFQE